MSPHTRLLHVRSCRGMVAADCKQEAKSDASAAPCACQRNCAGQARTSRDEAAGLQVQDQHVQIWQHHITFCCILQGIWRQKVPAMLALTIGVEQPQHAVACKLWRRQRQQDWLQALQRR